jgi:hypothetical protein
MSRNTDGPDTLGAVLLTKDASLSPPTVGRTWSQFSLGTNGSLIFSSGAH